MRGRAGFDSVGGDTVIDPSVEVFRQGQAPGRGVTVGSRCILYPRNRLVLGDLAVNTDAFITIGDRVLLNAGGYYSGEGGLEIGDHTLIGPLACILSAGHEFDDPGRNVQDQPLAYGRIAIGRDVWIGAGAIVLPGVTIGDGAVVASGAVVTRGVPSGGVVAGNPARILRYRGSEKTRPLRKRIREAWNALFSR